MRMALGRVLVVSRTFCDLRLSGTRRSSHLLAHFVPRELQFCGVWQRQIAVLVPPSDRSSRR
jgi:hypothetical protein